MAWDDLGSVLKMDLVTFQQSMDCQNPNRLASGEVVSATALAPLSFPSINLTKITRIESDLMVLEKGGPWRHMMAKGTDVLTCITWPDQIERILPCAS